MKLYRKISNIEKGLFKTSRFLLIFALSFSWVFSGWPQITLGPLQFPSDIPRAHAAPYDSTVEVLGGGGGGGVVAGDGGGGGGGGEYRRCTETLSVQSYTVTVGVGGTANDTGETDSTFSGTGITMTADGGNGTNVRGAGSEGTGGVSTNCDTAVANFDGGTPGAGVTQDFGGGAGGGAGYGGKGGNGSAAANGRGGGGGGGGGESGAGGDTTGSATAGTAGAGGGGVGGTAGTGQIGGSKGGDGVPATYHIVGGGGGGGSGGNTNQVGGACSLPGGGSGGGEAAGAGNGCRGEVRIIYVDAEVDATGGTETTSNGFRIHTFTSSGTFQVTALNATAPVLTTTAASGVTPLSATLNSNISSDGGATITHRGFAWGTNSILANGDTATTTEISASTGNFSQNVSGLIAGVTYYFRAYAANSVGTTTASNNGSCTTGVCSFTAGTDTTPSRILRIFEGFRLKIDGDGRVKVLGG